MRHANWIWIPVAAVSNSVYATTYFTVEQVQQAMLRGAKLVRAFITLTDAQRKSIEQRTSVKVPNAELRLWTVLDSGFLIVDEVVGKHEFITYALGLSSDGSMKRIEIMNYRESYGYEVHNAQWRVQFVGKTTQASLKFGQDIKNTGHQEYQRRDPVLPARHRGRETPSCYL
jgi:hypothetical protein